jgi:hypothetical protein
MSSDAASWIVHEIRKHGEECTMNTIDSLINYLYDECPVAPDEVPRKKLREMYLDYLKARRA